MSASLCFHFIIGILLCVLATPFSNLYAQAPAGEYEVKAAFLYNLARMVQWPEEDKEAMAPLNICFYGIDSFGEASNFLKNKKVKKRSISVIKDVELNGLGRCHILFIDKSELNRLAHILSIINNQPILTVSDVDTFAEKGGLVNLQKIGDRVNIQINLNSAKQAGLIISARLLALAEIVEQ